MEALVQFIKKTKELEKILDEQIPSEDREEYLIKIQELLDERQKHLSEFPDLSALREHTKLELMELEKKINSLMEQQKENIKKDLRTLQLKRKKNKQYSDPYGNFSIDGMFLDKKK